MDVSRVGGDGREEPLSLVLLINCGWDGGDRLAS